MCHIAIFKFRAPNNVNFHRITQNTLTYLITRKLRRIIHYICSSFCSVAKLSIEVVICLDLDLTKISTLKAIQLCLDMSNEHVIMFITKHDIKAKLVLKQVSWGEILETG